MNCMRHSSTCHDLRSAAPFGIAYLRSVAFVRGHGCFLLSLMAVFRAHVFFRDNRRREASKIPKFTRRANFTRGKKKRRKKEKEGKGSEMIKASLLGESTCHYR